jgi:hypothetical protein
MCAGFKLKAVDMEHNVIPSQVVASAPLKALWGITVNDVI